MTIRITLGDTLKDHEYLTRNKIAVQAKIRPATLHDLVNGGLEKVKSIPFETLGKILDAMNELDETRNYDISDIFVYEQTKDDDQ